MSAWQSIETAPKDEEAFLAWYDGKFGPSCGTMIWHPENEGRFHSMTLGTQTKDATHWMPLPDPPKEGT